MVQRVKLVGERAVALLQDRRRHSRLKNHLRVSIQADKVLDRIQNRVLKPKSPLKKKEKDYHEKYL